jgi:hypothetical protein
MAAEESAPVREDSQPILMVSAANVLVAETTKAVASDKRTASFVKRNMV